ncbi:hypothetical protein Purlil1_13019 [Purpureocillium lilacinum]|uniref:Uncharacterized protein n=1 Tax=Purpureocillium lilacinum TaxID=33203 RepID=A0ABR0BFF1_PURLI|nr:hypothetical protein Purlil1_13019 [Purpureocillium lilacinum]
MRSPPARSKLGKEDLEYEAAPGRGGKVLLRAIRRDRRPIRDMQLADLEFGRERSARAMRGAILDTTTGHASSNPRQADYCAKSVRLSCSFRAALKPQLFAGFLAPFGCISLRPLPYVEHVSGRGVGGPLRPILASRVAATVHVGFSTSLRGNGLELAQRCSGKGPRGLIVDYGSVVHCPKVDVQLTMQRQPARG